MILTNAPCEHGWPLRECDRHAVPMPAVDDHGLTVTLDPDEHRAAADLATAAAVVTAAVVVTVCVIVRDVIELLIGRRRS